MAKWLANMIGAAVTAYALSVAALAQEIEVNPASRKALDISTAPVLEDASISDANAFGTVIIPPGSAYSVASPFESVLIQPLVVLGMQVEIGDPVARLYSLDYETKRAEIETLRLTVEHMDYLAVRAKELQALGLRSAQEADEAEHDVRSARLALRASKSFMTGIRSVGGSGRFELLAPTSGIVSEISVDAGQALGRSEPFLSIFDGKRYWLDVVLPEQTGRNLTRGSEVHFPGMSEPGEVVAVDPKIDPHLQSMRIKIALPTTQAWQLGQLVDVSFDTHNGAGALTVPAQALVRMGGADCVFVQTDTGFNRINVTILARNRKQAVLHGNLKPGDEVAISGLAALKNLLEGA